MDIYHIEKINPQQLIKRLQKNIATIFPNEKRKNTKIAVNNDTITVLWQNYLVAEYIKNELMAYCDMEKSNIWGTTINVDNVPLFNISSYKLIRNVPYKQHTDIIASLFQPKIEDKPTFEQFVTEYNNKVEELVRQENIGHQNNDLSHFVPLFKKVCLNEIELLKSRVVAKQQSTPTTLSIDFLTVEIMRNIIESLSNDKVSKLVTLAQEQVNLNEERNFKQYVNKHILTQLLSEITVSQNLIKEIVTNTSYYQNNQIQNLNEELALIIYDTTIDITNTLTEMSKEIADVTQFLPNNSNSYQDKFKEKIEKYLSEKYNTDYLFNLEVEKLYNLLVKNFNAIYHQAENENKHLLWLHIINLTPFLNKEILRQTLRELKELNIEADAKAIKKLSQVLAQHTNETIKKYVTEVELLHGKIANDDIVKFTSILSYLDTENIISPQTFHKFSKSFSDNNVDNIHSTATNIIVSIISTYSDIVNKYEKENKQQQENTLLYSSTEAKELMDYYRIEEVFNKQNNTTRFENSFVNKLYLSKIIPIINEVDTYESLLVTENYIVYWNKNLNRYIFDSVLIRIMFSKTSKVEIIYHTSHITQSKLNTGNLIGDNQLCRLTNLSVESFEIATSYQYFMLSEHREMVNNTNYNKQRKQRMIKLYKEHTPTHHKNLILTTDKIGVLYQQYQVRNLLITNIITTNSIYTIYEGTNFALGGILATKATELQVSNHLYTINATDVMTPQKYFGGLFNRATDLRYTI